jgi:hypothetical protein
MDSFYAKPKNYADMCSAIKLAEALHEEVSLKHAAMQSFAKM